MRDLGSGAAFSAADYPETAAHCSRVAELCRRPGKKQITASHLYACRDFDEAMEFAAYEGSSLASAIERFLSEASGLYDPAISEALRSLILPRFRPDLKGNVPVLPAAASKLMRMAADEASVADLERIAASDPVLAARLLGVANSAIFGRGAEIRSLTQAILRLGIPFSRKTLLTACFGTLFASAVLAEIWKHSKTVAALAHELAAEVGSDPEIAYLAGLLHDIGRLLTQRCPGEIQAEMCSLLSAGFPLVYAETLMYGVDHAALGGDLLTAWRVPPELVEAVAFHHRPESTGSALAGILCLAEEESRTGAAPSESLSAGMRRAAAAEIAGLPHVSRRGVNRESPVFALAV